MKFKIIFSVIVFFIGCIPLIISGREELMNSLDVKQTLSGISGFIWAFIPSVLISNLDEIVKNNFSKLIGIHDPLFGNPIGRKDKIKHYKSDDDLPSFAKLVKIEKIKEVNILSISSYVLILRYINQIKEAIEHDIKFTFLIINPNSNRIKDLSKNFGGGTNLKCQIESSIEELCKIKNCEIKILFIIDYQL